MADAAQKATRRALACVNDVRIFGQALRACCPPAYDRFRGIDTIVTSMHAEADISEWLVAYYLAADQGMPGRNGHGEG